MARSSRSTSTSFAVLAVVAVMLRASPAAAQACCAGSGAITPARLGVHEDALAGVQLKNGYQIGSHDSGGTYSATPAGVTEIDLEQDVYGAVRVLGRGQVAALVPFVETHRRASGRAETGGGLGDVNLAVRYDFVLAHESQYVPGIGVLAGLTFPTGTSPESATNSLATDATGIGAVQGSGGVALEQAWDAWLVGLSGIVSVRAPRDVGSTRIALAPQVMALGSAGYALRSGLTFAAVVSYAFEGDATVGTSKVPGSARRITTLSLATAIPLSDQLRVVASVYTNPPISSFGENQPATAGLTVGMIGALL
jgi:hypothetical protein